MIKRMNPNPMKPTVMHCSLTVFTCIRVTRLLKEMLVIGKQSYMYCSNLVTVKPHIHVSRLVIRFLPNPQPYFGTMPH